MLAESVPLGFTTWPCPLAEGGTTPEMAVIAGETPALLIVPALFDEAAKMRRFTCDAMRGLASMGIASVLPDLGGCNESLAPLAEQTLAGWRAGCAAAAHFGVRAVLTIRGGALLAPAGLIGWRYAATTGAAQLQRLARVHRLAAREAGREESIAALLARASDTGLEVAGMTLGPAMVTGLASAIPDPQGPLADITAEAIGAARLWLRAEPGEDAAGARALAELIASALPT